MYIICYSRVPPLQLLLQSLTTTMSVKVFPHDPAPVGQVNGSFLLVSGSEGKPTPIGKTVLDTYMSIATLGHFAPDASQFAKAVKLKTAEHPKVASMAIGGGAGGKTPKQVLKTILGNLHHECDFVLIVHKLLYKDYTKALSELLPPPTPTPRPRPRTGPAALSLPAAAAAAPMSCLRGIVTVAALFFNVADIRTDACWLQENKPNAFIVFNDNQQCIDSLHPGKGSAGVRGRERTAGIPTGSHGVGYKKLDDHTTTIIKLAVANAAVGVNQMAAQGIDVKIIYFAEKVKDVDLIGASIFNVDMEVRRFITQEIHKIPALDSEAAIKNYCGSCWSDPVRTRFPRLEKMM